MSDEIVKKTDTSSQTGITQTGTGRRIGLPGLHNRLKQAEKTQAALDPLTMQNRIGIMPDVSGSMSDLVQGKQKCDHLKDALQSFISACDFTNTSLAYESFGMGHGREISVALCAQQGPLFAYAMGFGAHGGTPMDDAMAAMLNKNSITRGIIISDGCANNPAAALDWARNFKNAGVPCDTVHIGDERQGEELLQQIAEITGGMFIKFKDVASFGKNFKYLAPAFRGLLLNANNAAALIGADEVKR